jgi:hypothetical protein
MGDQEPELYGLIAEHEARLLTPVDIRLDLSELGPRATTMRRVALDMQLLMGLRAAVDEYRPLPYSASLCARRNGLHDERHASRVLRTLEKRKVIRSVDPLDPRLTPDRTKLRDGTKCYEPFGFDLEALLDRPELALESGVVPTEPSDSTVQGDAVFVEAVVEPAREVEQEPGVERAVTRSIDEVGVVTANSTAHSATDGNTASGGISKPDGGVR